MFQGQDSLHVNKGFLSLIKTNVLQRKDEKTEQEFTATLGIATLKKKSISVNCPRDIAVGTVSILRANI